MISDSAQLQPATYRQLSTVLPESRDLWGQGFNQADYLRYNIRLSKHPWSKSHYRHLALVNKVGKVLSSCKLYELQGLAEKRRLRIAEISEIFTPVERRNRGYALKMIDALKTQLGEEGFDLAVLFSDIPVDFFTRHGFKEIRKRDLVFDLVVPAKSRRNVIESRHKAPEVVVSLYKNSCSRFFSIERGSLYWDMLRYKRNIFNHLQWDMGCESLCFCEDGSAYAWTLWNGKSLLIKDIAYKDREAVADIFAHLLQRHGPDVLRGVYGWLPPQFDRMTFLRSKQNVWRTKGVLMFADITGKNKELLNASSDEIQFWPLDCL